MSEIRSSEAKLIDISLATTNDETDLNQILNAYHNKLTELKNIGKQIKFNKDTIISDIKSKSIMLQNIIKSRENELIRKVNKMESNSIKSAKEIKKQLNIELNQFKKCKNSDELYLKTKINNIKPQIYYINNDSDIENSDVIFKYTSIKTSVKNAFGLSKDIMNHFIIENKLDIKLFNSPNKPAIVYIKTVSKGNINVKVIKSENDLNCINIVEIRKHDSIKWRIFDTKDDNFVLKNLSVYKTYDVRCKIVNEFGIESEYSDIISIEVNNPNDLIIPENETFYIENNILNKFDNVIIKDGGVLTANGYNSDTKIGGILKLFVKETLRIEANGMITMNYKGYNGGKIGGYQGESYKIIKQIKSKKNNYGGGGMCSGGGYGSNGESCHIGFYSGKTYGNDKLNVLYMGSGGGGSMNKNGGNGGGIIKIISKYIIIEQNGGIYCNGHDCIIDSGAGSGGTIYIEASKIVNNGNIHAKGGDKDKIGNGGRGGFGRVKIDCDDMIQNGSILPEIFLNI